MGPREAEVTGGSLEERKEFGRLLLVGEETTACPGPHSLEPGIDL